MIYQKSEVNDKIKNRIKFGDSKKVDSYHESFFPIIKDRQDIKKRNLQTEKTKSKSISSNISVIQKPIKK